MTHHPIGYWIRKADQVLTAGIDEIQRSLGLTRLEWQVLNVVHEHGAATIRSIGDALAPFADTPSLVEVVERLLQRELVETVSESPTYALTDRGRRLHAAALEAQQQLRRRAMEGVSQEDYTTAVRVLARIVGNFQA